MEIVIALAIVGMLSVSMLSIIRNTVRAAAQTEELRRESDQINRLIESLRKAFATMPATATLALKIVQTTEPIIQELVVTGSPDCFPFGPNPIALKDTTFRMRPYPDGDVDSNNLPLNHFCLSRADLIPKTADGSGIQQATTGIHAPDEEGRYWMPLLQDVVSLKWRFFVDKDDTWVEEWSKSSWPDLIEMQFTLKDRTTPMRIVFGLPVVTITKGKPAPATNSSSSSSSSNGGGGGPPVGGGGGPPGGGGGGDGRGGPGGGRGGPGGPGGGFGPPGGGPGGGFGPPPGGGGFGPPPGGGGFGGGPPGGGGGGGGGGR